MYVIKLKKADHSINLRKVEQSITLQQVGRRGPQGEPGEPGEGVPTGGTIGQVLTKQSNANFDTDWEDVSVSSVDWGDIGGTLSNQTDLQSALDGKLAVANNLSDLDDATTSRDNLGAQSKISLVVGPTGDLGYITDGTADDVQINAAIQAVGAAGGGVVYVQAGTYDITDTIDNDQVGVLVKGGVVSHFAKVTYFLAGATFTTFATIRNTGAGGFEDIYLDGNNTVTDGLVIGTTSSSTKIKNPRVRNLRIEKFTGRGIGGTGTPASGAWDDVTFDNIRIATCGTGVENHSTKTTFMGGAVAACTNGVVALISSSADFFGTVFSTNTRDFDIQTTQSTGNYGFHSTYHESATNSILGRSTAPSGSDTTGGFTFVGSYLRNQSDATTGFALDFTDMGCTVILDNCSYDVASGASRTINVGTNTKVIVEGKGIGNTPLFTGETSNVTYFGDNRVGIGTGLPDTPLHVYQNDSGVGTNNGVLIEQDGDGDAILQYILTGVRRWVMGVDNSDSDKFKISPTLDLSAGTAVSIDTSGNIVTPGDISVADEVYGVGWNGSLEVPTKNAVYDKIETLADGVAWGDITGTLSDQTDLQGALDNKLSIANNLSDLASSSAGRTNLGLGSGDSPTFAGLTLPNDGVINFGADTNLYRLGPNDLSTDDNFTMGQLLKINAVTGNPEFDFQENGVTRSKTFYDIANDRLTFQNNQNNAADALFFADPATFSGNISLSDGANIITGTTTGMKIGTATTQKIGFYNATPIAQQTGVAVDAASIHAALVNLGLITA